jgi:prepilin-type N-terminal cleavage/methylation domain-containing protein
MAAYRINNKCTQKGYTLIELLLVVTVLAFIAAMGVKTYRDKAIADRANIAALNIQHVLEAGISYNIAENGLWPKKNWSNSTCTTTPDDDIFVKNYLPNNSNQSNLGVPLCWSGDDPTLGEQKAKRFWVALSVGSSSDSTIVALAQRIAARLPNAIITNNPDEAPLTATPTNTCTSGSCFVKAEVAIPSGGGIAGNSLVVGVGYCDSDVPASGRVYGTQPGSGTNISCRRTKISEQFPGVGFANPSADSLSQYEIDFQCRPGEFPKVYVTPNFVRMDRWQGQKLGDPAVTRAEPLFQLS